MATHEKKATISRSDASGGHSVWSTGVRTRASNAGELGFYRGLHRCGTVRRTVPAVFLGGDGSGRVPRTASTAPAIRARGCRRGGGA